MYVKGKTWYYYVPLWLLGVYAFVKLLDFNSEDLPWILAIPQAVDFCLHEMSHIVLAFMPAVITAAAGSCSELLLGSALIYAALKERSYFAVLFCGLWFTLACQSAGSYMADARAQRLSLVSLGGALSGSDQTIHDWNFVFGKLHVLSFDVFIGNSVRLVGWMVGLASVIFAAWLLYRMAASGN